MVCRRHLLSLRGILGCTSVTALFFATKYLPVADAIVFSFLAPVIVALLSPLLLGESSRGTWVVISGCSVGVLLVAQPGMLFGRARLALGGICLGILHAMASGTAKVCIAHAHVLVSACHLAGCFNTLAGCISRVASHRIAQYACMKTTERTLDMSLGYMT